MFWVSLLIRNMCGLVVLHYLVLLHFCIGRKMLLIINHTTLMFNLTPFFYLILIQTYRLNFLGTLAYNYRSYIELSSRLILRKYYLITFLGQHLLYSFSVYGEVEIKSIFVPDVIYIAGGGSSH